jgi:CHAT domain-containing protein
MNLYRSYLAMANGRLEAWNLFHDIAGADLIVLSACDTKLGPREYMKQTSTDESSITGFILRAGARRVVSSLWGATDSATESLMDAFYTALEHNPHDPARALQMAKASLAKPGRHPYTFANFVLSVQNTAAILLP